MARTILRRARNAGAFLQQNDADSDATSFIKTLTALDHAMRTERMRESGYFKGVCTSIEMEGEAITHIDHLVEIAFDACHYGQIAL